MAQITRGKQIVATSIILLLTAIGFTCAVVGLVKLPKCRYGSPACYFIVEVCAYSNIKDAPKTPGTQIGSSVITAVTHGKMGSKTPPPPVKQPDFCPKVTKSRAIEGSSSTAAEQLAIPILAVITACIPAIVSFGSILCVPKYLPFLEFVKIMLATSLVLLILGIQTVQNLTFDCRWWGDGHHGNAQKCHDGLNLYVAATALLMLGQCVLLVVSVHFMELTRRSIVKDL